MNNLLMLLPFLLGMKNCGNNGFADMMSILNGNGNFTKDNPMLSLLLNMMGKQKNPPEERCKKDTFEAIKNLSGSEVTEALKILLNMK